MFLHSIEKVSALLNRHIICRLFRFALFHCYNRPHFSFVQGPDLRRPGPAISQGTLTAAQVKVELERLLPGINWKWVVEEIDDKSFATTFPSEAELQRMVLWGPVVARGAKGTMEIKEKKESEVWKYEIPKAWIQFRGLPKELKEFPIIWAIGSIFGATRIWWI